MEYKSFMEALKGKQHKIDKNKNGEIDAQDFKLLRKEEEELEEAEVRVARADYKVGPSGRKSHKEIVFNDDESKEEMKEAKMSDDDMVERERIVKGMKKNLAGFKARYGDRAKEVMYATATKQAMKEETVDEAVQKADIPAYLRKQQGQTPLKLSDLKRKDTISDKENLAKLRNEELDESVFADKEQAQSVASKLKSKFEDGNYSVVADKDKHRVVHSYHSDSRVKKDIAKLNEEQIDEKSDQARQNKTMKNVMAASKGAQINRTLKLDPAEYGYKRAQHLNVAIGRQMMKAEEVELEEAEEITKGYMEYEQDYHKRQAEYHQKQGKPERVKYHMDKFKDAKDAAERYKKKFGEAVESIDEISLDTMKSAKEKLGNRAFQAHMDDNKYAAQHYAGRAMDMKKKIAQKERQTTKEELELDEKIIVDKDGNKVGGENTGHRLMNLPTKFKPTGTSTKKPITNPSLAPAKQATPPAGAKFKKSVVESVLDKIRSRVSGELEQSSKHRQSLAAARNQAAIDREHNHAATHAASAAHDQEHWRQMSKYRDDNHAAKLERDKVQQAHYNKQRDKINSALTKKVTKEEVELEEAKKDDVPFDGPYTKTKPVKNSDGTTQSPMSRARQLAKDAMKKQMKEDIDRLFEKDDTEYDYEGEMAVTQLKTIIRHAEALQAKMQPNTNLPEWVQSKITLATDYIQTASDYLHSELEEQAPVEIKEHFDSDGNIINSKVSYKEFAMMLEYEAKDGRYTHKGSYGGSYVDPEGADDADDKKPKQQSAEKRGRGRPAGAKSGAGKITGTSKLYK